MAAKASPKPAATPPSGTKKRKATIQKEERNLLDSLETLLVDDFMEQDYAYLMESLHPQRGESKQHVRKIASMLKKGTFDRLDARNVESTENEKLPDEMIKYRQLTKPLLIKMVVAWEPNLDNKLDNVPRHALLKWVTFALNVKEGHDLPHTEEHRIIVNFLLYTTARYQVLFSRLQVLRTLNEVSADSLKGYFALDVENAKIKFLINMPGRMNVTFDYDFADEDDWTLEKPFTLDCYVHSVHAGETKYLRAKLKAACNIELPNPSDEWGDNVNQTYQSLRSARGTAAPPSSASGGGGAPPPPGSGAAVSRSS